jgi:hypothetical protein
MSDKISTWTAVLTLSRVIYIINLSYFFLKIGLYDQLCLGPGLLVLPFATLKGGLIFSPIGIIVVSG